MVWCLPRTKHFQKAEERRRNGIKSDLEKVRGSGLVGMFHVFEEAICKLKEEDERK